MTRDCACPRARHEHGTPRAYNADGCRCAPCSRAHSRKLKHDRHRMAVVGIRTELTIASAVGVARRLQALACLGWSTEDLAPLLATSQPNIARWRAGKQTFVRPSTAARVRAVYDAVWDQPAPGRYGEKVRNIACRAGWSPPLAWDDDDLDNPTARPSITPFGARVFDDIAVERIMAGTFPAAVISPERIEAIRRLSLLRLNDTQIADRIGMTKAAVCQTRLRHGIPTAQTNKGAA